MNLEDLLDELREGILNDRTDRVSGSSDYLWSDTRLVRYINEAQRRFARLSLCLRDNTNADVTQVTLVEGQTEYPLHESVLAVVTAKLDGEAADLKRSGHSVFNAYTRPDTAYWDPSQLVLLPPGKPIAFAMDETVAEGPTGAVEKPVMRVFPAPNADYAGQKILLRVCRLPLNDLSLTNVNAYPEIPEIYHLEMLDWAAHLALRIVDQDAGNKARSDDFAASFAAKAMKARNDLLKKMQTPQQWGFGRNGWGWES